VGKEEGFTSGRHYGTEVLRQGKEKPEEKKGVGAFLQKSGTNFYRRQQQTRRRKSYKVE